MHRQPRSGFNRVPMVQVCACEYAGRRTSALICNLSILGVYLHFSNPPKVGTELKLRFRLPDEGNPVDAVASVTWVNDSPPDGASALPTGCGARFHSVAADDMRRIATVVGSFVSAPRERIQVGIAQPHSGKLRVPFITPCVYRDDHGESHGSLCNLSMLGVYATLDRIPAAGDSGRIHFEVPGFKTPFECGVTVAWANPDFPTRIHALPPGCGLRFDALSPVHELVLTSFVTDYLKFLEKT